MISTVTSTSEVSGSLLIRYEGKYLSKHLSLSLAVRERKSWLHVREDGLESEPALELVLVRLMPLGMRLL